MKNILLLRGLRPADRIVVPKSDMQWVQHHAIYLGRDYFGIDWIAENKNGKGVQIVTSIDFFSGVSEVTRVERFNGSELERQNAVKNARALVGINYDLFKFNCEHYANIVQNRPAISKQAQTGAGLGLLALFIGVLIISK